MNKRIIALFIVFIMILGMVPSVFGVDFQTQGNDKLAELKIHKRIKSGKNINSPGSHGSYTFNLKGPNDYDVTLTTNTDGEGEHVTFKGLIQGGTYTITEIGLDTSIFSHYYISANGNNDDDVGKNIKIENGGQHQRWVINVEKEKAIDPDLEPTTGTVIITKVFAGEDDSPVSGIEFTITYGQYTKTEETDSDGKATFTDVPSGGPYIIEELNHEEYTNDIASMKNIYVKKGSIETRTVTNTKIPDPEPETIKITIEKRITNGEGQSVEGFVFELWQEDQTVYTFDATDSSGLTSLDVAPGSYTFLEALTPEQQEIFEEHPSSEMVLEEDKTHIVNNKLKEVVPDSPKRAEYKVEHYRRDDVNDPYVLIDTDYKTGLIGGLTNAQANFYSGYYYNVFNQEVILADGNTVVKIYYDKIIDEEPEPEPDPEGVPHTIEKILLDHLGNRIGDDSNYFTIQLEQLIDDEWIVIKTYELKGNEKIDAGILDIGTYRTSEINIPNGYTANNPNHTPFDITEESKKKSTSFTNVKDKPEETVEPEEPYYPPYVPEPEKPERPIPPIKPEPKPEVPPTPVEPELPPAVEPELPPIVGPEPEPEIPEPEVTPPVETVPKPQPKPEPTLPKTGTASTVAMSSFGTLLLAAGLWLQRKKK